MTARTNTYYDATASQYDMLHALDPEHSCALEIGWPLFKNVSSVLDVGVGTGRCLIWLNDRYPALRLAGVDPSQGMVDLARANLPAADISQATGEDLPFRDDRFDICVATGIMHHVDRPPRVIDEMFRVARLGVLISDHNNFAFGGYLSRRLRMALRVFGLLAPATFLKQGFKTQRYSKEDGWWYPYSLFDNHAQISKFSKAVFIIPTRPPTGDDGNLLFSQSHFAIVALKA